mmetsp:Transcript_5926/g.17712  ORF Transcript_5926/g.17712 Transcript_5926/m.17712 type:complete len:229 (+) Transcript_5926:750-1436(+)
MTCSSTRPVTSLDRASARSICSINSSALRPTACSTSRCRTCTDCSARTAACVSASVALLEWMTLVFSLMRSRQANSRSRVASAAMNSSWICPCIAALCSSASARHRLLAWKLASRPSMISSRPVQSTCSASPAPPSLLRRASRASSSSGPLGSSLPRALLRFAKIVRVDATALPRHKESSWICSLFCLETVLISCARASNRSCVEFLVPCSPSIRDSNSWCAPSCFLA